MNPVIGAAIGLFLSASLVVSAQAAPAKAVSNPGTKNAKKVMVAKLRQDAKTRTVKKQAIAVKQQTLAKKPAAQ